MRLDGRRESSNVDDRRGMSGGAKAGLGLGGIVLIAVMTFLSGGNLGDVITNVGTQMASQNVTTSDQQQREFTEEEQAMAKFSSQVLASTEDIWGKVFESMGRQYQAPKMVLYTNAVQTACGRGTASVGPFYCSGDQCLYIDLSFFTTMRRSLGLQNKGDLDFAFAYVIAHEVGHHVEYLLGTLNKAHQAMSRTNKVEAVSGATMRTRLSRALMRTIFRRPLRPLRRLVTTTCRRRLRAILHPNPLPTVLLPSACVG